jgi:hypothetical protein
LNTEKLSFPQPQYGPDVDSSSKIYEYQYYPLGAKGGPRVKLPSLNADYMYIFGAPISRKPKVLSRLVNGYFTFIGYLETSDILDPVTQNYTPHSNETIGNRTRDLKACSAVPQTTTSPRASFNVC